MQPGRAQDGGQSLHHCEDTADGAVFAFSSQSFWFGPLTSLCELSHCKSFINEQCHLKVRMSVWASSYSSDLQIMSALFLLPDVTWDRDRDGTGLP